MKSFAETMQFMGPCSVCGESAPAADPETVLADWLGKPTRHTDPNVCAENLRFKIQELKKKIESLEQK